MFLLSFSTLLFLLSMICFNTGVFSIIFENQLANVFKKGIVLQGEIIQVFKLRDGKNSSFFRPRVSVLINGKERIFQAIVMVLDYKLHEEVAVFYNEEKYPDLVLIFKRRQYIRNCLLLILLLLSPLAKTFDFFHEDFIEKYGNQNFKLELLIVLIIIILSIYPAIRLAKLVMKKQYFNEANAKVKAPSEKSYMALDNYQNILDTLRTNRSQCIYDNNTVVEAISARDAIKNDKRYSAMNADITIALVQTYVDQTEYELAYKTVESIDIIKVVRSRNWKYNWPQVVEILSLRMKIYNKLGKTEKLEKLIYEGRPLMKRAEKYFQKNDPNSEYLDQIRQFYKDCSLTTR